MGDKFYQNEELLQIAKTHPCLSREANASFGRLHLPVSPACNIQCRFCSRSRNKTEQRPGVTAQVLQPEQAVEKVRQALELCPQITVAGIAGPGDTLATDAALRTFRLVHPRPPAFRLKRPGRRRKNTSPFSGTASTAARTPAEFQEKGTFPGSFMGMPARKPFHTAEPAVHKPAKA